MTPHSGPRSESTSRMNSSLLGPEFSPFSFHSAPHAGQERTHMQVLSTTCSSTPSRSPSSPCRMASHVPAYRRRAPPTKPVSRHPRRDRFRPHFRASSHSIRPETRPASGASRTADRGEAERPPTRSVHHCRVASPHLGATLTCDSTQRLSAQSVPARPQLAAGEHQRDSDRDVK